MLYFDHKSGIKIIIQDSLEGEVLAGVDFFHSGLESGLQVLVGDDLQIVVVVSEVVVDTFVLDFRPPGVGEDEQVDRTQTGNGSCVNVQLADSCILLESDLESCVVLSHLDLHATAAADWEWRSWSKYYGGLLFLKGGFKLQQNNYIYVYACVCIYSWSTSEKL
uniref:Streptomycin 3''-adenylyltransferase n=1 Tax=Lygus hesperus TaxID=30085 RepID=A0A0A9VSU8_LYGHE